MVEEGAGCYLAMFPVIDIKRKIRRKSSSEEKVRFVLEGLRGKETIAELCIREGINLIPLVWGSYFIRVMRPTSW